MFLHFGYLPLPAFSSWPASASISLPLYCACAVWLVYSVHWDMLSLPTMPSLRHVGHNTKLTSMGYAPALIAGLILLSQRKYVLGFIVTLLFSTLLTWQNHVQILYYTFLIAACLGVAMVVRAFREKDFKPVIYTAGLAIVALVIGIASYAVILMPTNSYSKESMRGGRSELTVGPDGKKLAENKTKGGLDKSYAFHWSYGIGRNHDARDACL